jgi:hypothetical protein
MKTRLGATCHPNRPHHAFGLCQQCYGTNYRATHREERRAAASVYCATHSERKAA